MEDWRRDRRNRRPRRALFSRGTNAFEHPARRRRCLTIAEVALLSLTGDGVPHGRPRTMAVASPSVAPRLHGLPPAGPAGFLFARRRPQMSVKLTVNNQSHELDIDPNMPLLWAI